MVRANLLVVAEILGELDLAASMLDARFFADNRDSISPVNYGYL